MSTVELANELRDDGRGITREEYDALIAAGLLEDQKVELLRGLIVEMAAKGVPRDAAVEWLTWRLARGLGEDYRVRPQSAWAASFNSQPEPDLAVVPGDWRQRTPRTHDSDVGPVLAVDELAADKTLARTSLPRCWPAPPASQTQTSGCWTTSWPNCAVGHENGASTWRSSWWRIPSNA